MIHIFDYILLYIMIIATIITFYMTMVRLFYGDHFTTYDSWMFGMCFAITVTAYDHIKGI